MEHEVVDDELTPPIEQINQARLACRSLEDVFLVDLDHRERAACGVHRVPLVGELLFLGEQLLRALSHCSYETTWGGSIVLVVMMHSPFCSARGSGVIRPAD
jgi:hypothetical protein